MGTRVECGCVPWQCQWTPAEGKRAQGPPPQGARACGGLRRPASNAGEASLEGPAMAFEGLEKAEGPAPRGGVIALFAGPCFTPCGQPAQVPHPGIPGLPACRTESMPLAPPTSRMDQAQCPLGNGQCTGPSHPLGKLGKVY